MTLQEQIITIAVLSVAVILTRCLPFLLFPSREKTPRFVLFLGQHLASAVFGMLVIYCLKDVPLLQGVDDNGHPTYHGAIELTAVALTVLLHLWRKNLLLTMAGGTLAYILLELVMGIQ